MAALLGTFPDFPSIHETSVSGAFDLPIGSTKNIGTPNAPVRRRVRLHDQPSGRLLRELWSDEATGAYQFRRVRAGIFYVLALDHTGLYGAEAESDIVVPTP